MFMLFKLNVFWTCHHQSLYEGCLIFTLIEQPLESRESFFNYRKNIIFLIFREMQLCFVLGFFAEWEVGGPYVQWEKRFHLYEDERLNAYRRGSVTGYRLQNCMLPLPLWIFTAVQKFGSSFDFEKNHWSDFSLICTILLPLDMH